MKNAAQCAEKLTLLLERLEKSAKAPAPAGSTPYSPLDVLVQSMLMWDATTDKAMTGFQKLHEGCVDYNDMRVNMPLEFVEMLGVRYPKVEDRADRLRAVLRDVFMREHGMTLTRLADMGKRELRHYFETLDGIAPYAAARVLLLVYDVHTFPVDAQLREALISHGVVDESMDEAELSAWLARQIPAEQARTAHLALQQWIDGGAARKRRRTTSSPSRNASSSGSSSAADDDATQETPRTTTTRKKSTAEADVASE